MRPNFEGDAITHMSLPLCGRDSNLISRPPAQRAELIITLREQQTLIRIIIAACAAACRFLGARFCIGAVGLERECIAPHLCRAQLMNKHVLATAEIEQEGMWPGKIKSWPFTCLFKPYIVARHLPRGSLIFDVKTSRILSWGVIY